MPHLQNRASIKGNPSCVMIITVVRRSRLSSVNQSDLPTGGEEDINRFVYNFSKINQIIQMALNVSCNSHSHINILKGYI